MILIDVNVLVYAHRRDLPYHARYRGWLEATLNSEAAYGLAVDMGDGVPAQSSAIRPLAARFITRAPPRVTRTVSITVTPPQPIT